MAIAINGSSNTITGLAVGGLPDASVTAADLASGLASQGITMAQQWRITSNFNVTDANNDITISSNWEVVDTDGGGTIGSSLSNSSGIFTFPSTGIYLINAHSAVESQWPDTTSVIWGIRLRINTTTDNSNYSEAALGQASIQMNPTQLSEVNCQFIFDVTNTSTHKFKLSAESYVDTTTFKGDTASNETGFFVIRLGDT